MWNITVINEQSTTIYPQYEKFDDAIREAQQIANIRNSPVSVHKAGGHYKIVHPQKGYKK